jgi:hypothetical protein
MTPEEYFKQWGEMIEALNKFFNETLPEILKPIIELLQTLAPYARHWGRTQNIKRYAYQRALQLKIIGLSNARLQTETQ